MDDQTIPTMTVPKRRRANDPADRLVSTARDLFCKQGIAATGVQEVLDAAGVSRMTLYNRFGSKQALVNAALELEGRQWRTWFFDAIEQAGRTPRQGLLNIFAVLEDWFSRDDYYGCGFINAISESDKSDQDVRTLALEHKSQVKGFLQHLAREAGLDNPEGFVDQLILIIDGAIVCRLGNPRASLRGPSEALLSLLLTEHGGDWARKPTAA